MKKKSQKHNWIVDLILFIGFVFAFLLDLTGLSWHQWLGVFVGVLSGYHIFIHWQWIKSVTQRFFIRTSNQARVYYLLDAGLLAGFALILVIGLLISSWLDLTLENYATWVDLHIGVSILTLVLVVIKIGLHWRWIVNTFKRQFLLPAPSRPTWRVPQPTGTNRQVSRREFLSLMGIVGAASFVALTSALKPEENVLAGEPEVQGDELPQNADLAVLMTQDSSIKNASSNATTDDCVVQCRRDCTYPGRCRKFVDRNQNNICDLTECA